MNISEILAISSAIVPDREAVVFEGTRLTFAQLQERTYRLASALADLGVGPGDRVAAIQVNCNQHIEAAFATALLDAVYVPMSFRVRSDELAFMVNDSGPRAFLVGSRYVDMVGPLQKSLTTVEHYVALEGAVPGWQSYDDLLEHGAPEERVAAGGGDELAMLMFTAGTTGSPKGVMLSHDSFSSYILANVDPADPEEEEVEKNLLTVPLYHIAGLQAVMAAVYGGRTLVIQRQFDPHGWMELVQRERADRAMLVPTMLKQVIDSPEFHSFDLSSLKVVTYGAAPMPLEVIKRAIQAFPGCRFINAFGQTETASTITMLPPDDHAIPEDASPEERERRLKRLTSIGKPLPDVEVRIVDEDANDVAQGVTGEIVASGPRLMKGYWRQEAATRETLRGGWLYTGDLGYTDADGYIFLAGRAKDFIKRGGEMVSPEEVERVLMSHPAVDDAAIIGVPDVDWGERVRAVVVLRPGAAGLAQEELVEYCRERLASFKKPESVVFTDALPRNPMGKVLKRVLQEQYGEPIAGGS